MIYASHNQPALSAVRTATPRGAEMTVANLLLAAATVALCVGYVMMTIATSSHKIEARGARERILTLREQEQRLEIQAVTERSMDAIEARVSELGLVPVERVEYVDMGGGAVAVR